MQKKIKLLVLIKHIDGGTGTFLLQFLKLNRYFDIKTIVLGKEQYRLFKNKDYSVEYFAGSSYYPEYYRFNSKTFLTIVREVVWLTKRARAFQPNIILGVDTHCNLLAHLIKLLSFKKANIVISFHNNIEGVTNKKLSPFLKFLLKKIGWFFFNNSSAVVCVSEGITKETKHFFSISLPIHTISYGIDVGLSRKLALTKIPTSESRLFNNGPTVISIGRFEVQKDFSTLIRAFYQVHQKVRNVKLVLIGDGYQRDELFNLTRSLRLQDCVYFLGWKANVFPYLKRATVFVLSSFYEGFGYVLLEAMTQGLPVVSTNVPFGPAEVLGNGKYGLLVPIKDANRLAASLVSLLMNKETRNYYSKQSSNRVNNFTLELMLMKYMGLLSVLENRK